MDEKVNIKKCTKSIVNICDWFFSFENHWLHEEHQWLLLVYTMEWIPVPVSWQSSLPWYTEGKGIRRGKRPVCYNLIVCRHEKGWEPFWLLFPFCIFLLSYYPTVKLPWRFINYGESLFGYMCKNKHNLYFWHLHHVIILLYIKKGDWVLIFKAGSMQGSRQSGFTEYKIWQKIHNQNLIMKSIV